MRSSTGRWVVGEDFFDRKSELAILRARAKDRNHVVLSGQRRMGKTSLLQELGHQLTNEGWLVLFVDVEAATCAEDVIADIAQAAYAHLPLMSRLKEGMRHWLNDSVEELDVHNFRVRLRANLDSGSWRRHGDRLLADCADSGNRVLLIIDELPIFLKRLLNSDGNGLRVEGFLSWLRGAVQTLGEDSPIVFLSGSIGLGPLVKQLGISDRINYLDAIRLGPWNRDASIACIEELASSHEIGLDEGVCEVMYELLGLGIPHHVQSFFARLRDRCIRSGKDALSVDEVTEVYQNDLLGAPGQNDLVHYESRLKEALGESAFSIAMEILAEAALESSFTEVAKLSLVDQYQDLVEDVPRQISEVLDVLTHDGYLECKNGNYHFPSNLLRDWWTTRFRDHHVPLLVRRGANER